jgi:hypothetical protein
MARNVERIAEARDSLRHDFPPFLSHIEPRPSGVGQILE